MFDYFKGILTNKSFPYCSVECSGVAYRFFVNSRTLANIGEIDSEIKIYAKLIHKEDSMTLCGFSNKQDRIIFDMLTNISGIGVKAAMSLLDEFETNDFINAVISQDSNAISRTKGIGSKTAQKIVLELKDKLTKMEIAADIISSGAKNPAVSKETISQTVSVLESLGYIQSEYKNALENAVNLLKKDDAQELLKEVLKILSIF